MSERDIPAMEHPESLLSPQATALWPAPSRADKVRRALWRVVSALTFRLTPTPFHGVRCAILRAFGGRIERGARPYPAARIWAPWNLVMEHGSCLADRVDCYNVAPITVKRHATVSQGASLCTASHDFRRSDHPLTAAPIVVGEGAWVAAEAFIGPGVTVDEKAVVGARAVVMRSVPPSTVVAGNPAKIVDKRIIQNPAP
ncbi:MAG: putative colanic acid biosynthesis acetyltransferase [Pseudomonadota bacterium]